MSAHFRLVLPLLLPMLVHALSPNDTYADPALSPTYHTSSGTQKLSNPVLTAKRDPVQAITLAYLSHSSFGIQPTRKPFSIRQNPEIASNGWLYLFNRLVEQGVDPTKLAALLTDPRMPNRETIYFNARPKEPRHIYSGVNTKKNRKHALEFYAEHAKAFKQAEAVFGVPRSVLLSILQVETHCGKNVGKSRVIYRLAYLASAAQPEVIDENIEFNMRKYDDISPEEVAKRAHFLEDTFMPHVLATILVAEQMRISPLELKGSSAGAIGYGQFLPGNVLAYGVDANKDKRIDAFSPEDAIHSVANFLRIKGWNKPKMSMEAKRNVIAEYNKSDPYISTVLAMADGLAKEM